MAKLVGIDIGGTFTDFVFIDGQAVKILKLPTHEGAVHTLVREGISQLGNGDGVPVMHGTTVATNALLERRGAKTALVCTSGFEDILEIGRQNRTSLYELSPRKPEPLIPRELRHGIPERTSASGERIQPMCDPDIDSILKALERQHVDSVAICLLNSYARSTHEEILLDKIRERFPEISITASSNLLSEYREYERMSTTVANAYLSPVVSRYLSDISRVVPGHDVSVMQSSGGLCSVETATKEAAKLVLSGPAAGVAGAFAIARQSRIEKPYRLLTLDMGGTSTDVCLSNGRIPLAASSTVGGVPLRFPSVDIHTVGAGGGSIAWIDDGNVLRVGPRSAGSSPGPACYGRGGVAATVTDANLLLGRIVESVESENITDFVLHPHLAETAVQSLAHRLGLDLVETALGIVRLANSSMEQALRSVSVAAGFDPREYTLVPFGGAGPLHACALAESLDISRIMIVPYPGVLSAFGLCVADHSHSRSATVLATLSELAGDASRLKTISKTILGDVQLFRDVFPDAVLIWSADVRYVHQSHEVVIDVLEPGSRELIAQLKAEFELEHKKLYGYILDQVDTELVTLRLTATSLAKTQSFEVGSKQHGGNESRITSAWFDSSGPVDVPVIPRTAIEPDQQLPGPVMVTQSDCTILVTEGWSAKTDSQGILYLSTHSEPNL